ncbi:MAG: tetratricopeptide repeat protein [Candidatus Omnitrophota bacterium]
MHENNNKILNPVFLTLILCVAGFIIYSNTLAGSFQLDDHIVIIDNTAVKNISNPGGIWKYWPTRFITNFSFAVNYQMGKLNVLYYHLFNLLIHIGSAILVWRLMLLTLISPGMKGQGITNYREEIAFFAGLVFLTHPIQTQAVSYIVQRATSMSGFFCILSMYLYARAALLDGKFYFGALLAGIIAMFTKESAVILPFTIMLYDFFFITESQSSRWKRIAPFLFTLFIIPATMFFTRSIDFANMCRVQEGSPGIAPANYLMTQFGVIVEYMKLLIVPVSQNVDHDYRVALSFTQPQVFMPMTALIFVLIIGVKTFSKYKLISFGIFWFFITLLPESSVIPIADVMFEHRLYLPMLGYSVFLAGLIYYALERTGIKTVKTVMMCLVIIYCAMTYSRNFVWQSEVSLWDDAVRKSPAKSRVYNNRGYAYLEKDRFDLAIKDFDKAIALEPDIEAGYYYNRGNVYNYTDKPDAAIADYSKAIEMNPYYGFAYIGRAFAYFKKKDFDKSKADVARAKSLGYETDAISAALGQ